MIAEPLGGNLWQLWIVRIIDGATVFEQQVRAIIKHPAEPATYAACSESELADELAHARNLLN
jgi:hypothetical protein